MHAFISGILTLFLLLLVSIMGCDPSDDAMNSGQSAMLLMGGGGGEDVYECENIDEMPLNVIQFNAGGETIVLEDGTPVYLNPSGTGYIAQANPDDGTYGLAIHLPLTAGSGDIYSESSSMFGIEYFIDCGDPSSCSVYSSRSDEPGSFTLHMDEWDTDSTIAYGSFSGTVYRGIEGDSIELTHGCFKMSIE